jgi:fructose transport system substrate-binding protein
VFSKRIIPLAMVGIIVAACGGSGSSPAASSGASAGASGATGQVIVGLITKTETNPFFVKMKEGAQAAADKLGIKLMTGAGAKDGDNTGQVTALENMVNAGAKGILITPSDTKAIVPSIQKARDKGLYPA